MQARIRKELNADEPISTSELVDTITESLRTRRKSNIGGGSNTSRGRADRGTGEVDRQKSTSDSNGNSAESGGNQSRLTKYSKEEKPPQGGSFNAHRDEILSDMEENYGTKYTDDFNETGFILLNDPPKLVHRSTQHAGFLGLMKRGYVRYERTKINK